MDRLEDHREIERNQSSERVRELVSDSCPGLAVERCIGETAHGCRENEHRSLARCEQTTTSKALPEMQAAISVPRLHGSSRQMQAERDRSSPSRRVSRLGRLRESRSANGGNCIGRARNGTLMADRFKGVVAPSRAGHLLTRARRKSEQFA